MKLWERARPWLAVLLVLGICHALWPTFEKQRILASWFAPRIFTVWAMTGLFVLASLSIGVRVTGWLQGPLRRDGFWAQSFATGVLCFGLGVAVLGHAGLLVEQAVWLLPVGCLLAGWTPLVEALIEARHRLPKIPRLDAMELLLFSLGLVGLVLALAPVLTPENINFDSRWYHLGIAERYSVEHAITPSLEGNHLIAGPHLASLLYTWAFIWPFPLFDRVLLASHLEVVCFLGTLAAVPPLARALAPKNSPALQRSAWVTVMLFPMLYIYDTALMGGADHVAALWAPLAMLTFFQARERGDGKSWVLFGVNLGALALAKYTSVLLVAPLIGLTVIVAAISLRQREGRWKRLQGPVLAGVAALVVTSAHWLRNLVFYGNPVYPLAAKLFPTHPWTQDSAIWHARYSRELFVPSDGTLALRAHDTLRALWDYHLELYTWEDFTQKLPIFGSLYAVSLVVLPFIRGTKRLWLVAVLMHVGIAIWFNLAHQLRYLTILVPVMGAACAVTASEMWRWRHLGARVVLVGVVVAQLVVAGDVPFAPTHRMNGAFAPLERVIVFLGRGLTEKNLERFKVFQDWEQIGQALPPAARILVHSMGPSLGVNHVTYNDTPGLEYGLNYAELGSVSAIVARLREMGVSHVAWREYIGQSESVAGELLFLTLVSTALHQDERVVMHGWVVASLSEELPVEPTPTVLYVGCGSTYANGLYPMKALGLPVAPSNVDQEWSAPQERGESLELLARANYVVQETTCPSAQVPGPAFEQMGRLVADGVTRAFFRRRAPVP